MNPVSPNTPFTQDLKTNPLFPVEEKIHNQLFDEDDLSSDEDPEGGKYISYTNEKGEPMEMFQVPYREDVPVKPIVYITKVGKQEGLEEELAKQFEPGTKDYKRRLRRIKEEQHSFEEGRLHRLDIDGLYKVTICLSPAGYVANSAYQEV